jgi:hypothetical protein
VKRDANAAHALAKPMFVLLTQDRMSVRRIHAVGNDH